MSTAKGIQWIVKGEPKDDLLLMVWVSCEGYMYM